MRRRRLDQLPVARGDFAVDQDLAGVGGAGEQCAVFWMRPRYGPHGTVVAF